MKSDAMAENFNSDEIGVVPCKKRKTDSSVDTARENAEPEPTSASKNNLFLNRPDPGRHLRYHSVEQDDIQSSSGNSSNMENGNLTEDDSGNISDTSSHASSSDWQPRPTGVLSWVHTQMMSGVDPREILGHLLSHFELPPEVSDLSLWKLIVNILSEPERRTKLENVNTLEDVVNLIKNAKKILVLTGAGVSVSCGIPDFRSRDGVYSRLAVDFPDLPDPQAIFDITYFMQDPRPFFKFAKEIYPGQFEPSRGHRFISLLQKTGRLLRNYSQNIDTLEQVAGISNVIQCHGSFATATCLRCNFQTDCEAVREDIFNQTVPRCPKCPPGDELSIMKPDIVFFGENLPEEFHRQMTKDKDQADLLIVIGSSLKVRPVALIPNSLPNHIPQVLINREPLPHVEFDVELLGDGDLVVSELCKRLEEEFSVLGNDKESLTQITYLPSDSSSVAEHKGSASGDASNLVEDTSVTPEKNEPSQPATELVQGDDNNNTCGWSLNKSDHDGLNHTDDVTATGTMEATNAKEVTASSDTEPTDRNDTIKLMRGTCGISDTHTNNPTHVTDTTDADIDVQSSLTDSNQEKAVPVNHEAKNSVNVCMDSTISKEPCGDDGDSGEKVKEGGESGNDDMPPSSNSDSENEFLRSLWKSKWKQSISKRLPAGTFYYDGGHRYIFPGAEVAPEEDDDVSDSDFDTPGAGEDNGKSSSDESEEDIKGPGGLSSTRRNLKTSLSHANSCIPFNLPKFHQPDRQCCTMKHEGHSAHCSERDGTSKKEKPDDTSHKSPARSSEVPSNLKNEAKGLNASGSIIPDELHELIEMETLPMDSKRENVPGGQLHSPMSPSLHQILHYNPMRAEDTRILDKVEHDVLDTDQILEIPSSSLLPSLDGLLPVLHDTRNTRDTSPRMTEQNSDSKSQESET